ncbi:unnamed protein product [Phaedon cochleariae]|uniref:Uncharacterized protein n=1 Tax=Phaedon cochleariae TaxID=80249 RepID=A0A9N9X1C1_PHACE|nr:unnamed protein product [Phaedon cochleariae]
MNDASMKLLLDEMKQNKEESKNAIQASECRLQLTIEDLKKEIVTLEKENSKLQNKVELIERNNKRNNIIVFGLGKHKNCPVKIEFISYLKKNTIFQKISNLKNTGIAIAHDLTQNQQEEFKILKSHLRGVRKDNSKKSYLRGNKLIVDGIEYTAEDLQERENILREHTISEPSTPTQSPATAQIISKKIEVPKPLKETLPIKKVNSKDYGEIIKTRSNSNSSQIHGMPSE